MIEILFVDDEPELLSLAKDLLKADSDLRVTTVGSGEECLELIGSKDFDIIISDYQMPGMNGIELLRSIRKSGGDIPFILLTGKGREEVAMQALNSGATFYLQKGFDIRAQFSVLRNMIDAAVDRIRSARELGENKRFLETLIGNLPGMVFRCLNDEDWTMTFISDGCLEVTGYTPDELVLNKISSYNSIIHPEDRHMVHESIAKSLAIGEKYQIVYRIVTKSGDVRYVWEQGSGVIWPKEDLVLEGYITDLTEQVNMDIRLHRLYRRLSMLNECNHILLMCVDEKEIISKALDCLIGSGEFKIAWFSALQDGELVIRGMSVRSDEECEIRREEMLACPVAMKAMTSGRTAETGIHGTTVDCPFLERHPERGCIAFPVKMPDNSWSSLIIGYDTHEQFIDEDLRLLSELATGVSIAISSRHLEKERDAAREEMNESNRKFRDLVDFLPDPLVVKDMEGRVTVWNKAMEKLTGVPSEKMLGMKDGEYAVPIYGMKRPFIIDLLGSSDEEIGRWYDRFERDGDTVIAWTFAPSLGQKGRDIWIISAPLYGRYGKRLGGVEVVKDITDIMTTQKRLEESEGRYRELVERAAELIFVLDGNGTILSTNPSFRGTFDEADGMNVDAVLGVGSLNRLRKWALDKQGGFVDISVKSSDGAVHHLEATVRSLSTTENAHGLLVIARDVTERKEAERSIKLANRKVKLIGDITRHDMMNKLTALKGFLQLSQRSEDWSKYESRMEDLINSMADEMEFLREYQKLGSVAPNWFAVDEEVRKAMRLYGRSIEISVQALDGLEVLADPMYPKVFENLINNSVRHGGKVAQINVRAVTRGSDLEIAVEDDGVGIERSRKGSLFDLALEGRTGHGLHFIAEVLAITGITIREEGESGQGARFVMTVPWGAYRYII